MNVICIEEDAFYELVEQVVDRLKEKYDVKEDKWILGEEAMKLLGIKSKTTLQKLRDQRKIRFSQPERKIIVYCRDSIYEYLEKKAIEPFQ
jgi:hypothetical protein